MCPHANGDMLPADASQMVPVDMSHTNGSTNGVNGDANGHVNGNVNGRSRPVAANAQPRNPYAPRYADFLSNVSNFNIIESTLRGVLTMINFTPTRAHHVCQRASNLQTHSLIPRPKLRLLKP